MEKGNECDNILFTDLFIVKAEKRDNLRAKVLMVQVQILRIWI